MLYVLSDVQRLEVADDGVDIDIEGGNDQKDVDKKMMPGIVEEVTVEEFFVKYKNLWVSDARENCRMFRDTVLMLVSYSAVYFTNYFTDVAFLVLLVHLSTDLPSTCSSTWQQLQYLLWLILLWNWLSDNTGLLNF